MRRKKTSLRRPVSRSYPVRARRRTLGARRRSRSIFRLLPESRAGTKAALGGVVIVVLLVGGLSFLLSRHQDSEQFVPIEKASRQFTPLMPQNRNDGDAEYRFDEERNVLSFNTEYSGVNLTVSQQVLPKDFDEQALADLALQLNAESSIDSDNGPVYIASDIEGDGQTAIFASSEALIFIRASSELSAQQWKSYINQLLPR